VVDESRDVYFRGSKDFDFSRFQLTCFAAVIDKKNCDYRDYVF
jgi:hypothetical protein